MFPGLILTRSQLRDAVARLKDADAFAFDIESVGARRGHPVYNEVTWVSLATYGYGCAIPMGHPNGDRQLAPPARRKDRASGKFVEHPAVWDAPPAQLAREEVFEALAPLMESDRLKIAHNASIDLVSVAKYLRCGIPAPPYHDTIVGVWLLDENRRSKKLKDLIEGTYGVVYDHEHTGRAVERHGISAVGRYGYFDARYDWLLHRRLARALRREGFETLMALEMQVLQVVAAMRLHGAHVDTAALNTLSAALETELAKAQAELFQAAGREFNINSAPQKQRLLYADPPEGRGLAPKLLTKGGQARARTGAAPVLADYSTSSESLEGYQGVPVVAALLRYQEVDKLDSTYVRAYLGTEDKLGVLVNDRIHTDFVQYGTVTGRFSSRDPNLQNVPRPGTELATKVRALFTAPDGHRLVVADYGQIELRVLAHYLGRGALYDGFHEGIDAHTATAMLVFGVEIDGVTKAMRQVAKAINFAIVYGAGPAKVAAMAKITVAEAKRILQVHERQFPEIYQFKQAVIDTCRSREHPYVTTLLGRRRRLPEIRYRDPERRSLAERQAVNSLIQGSAGDLIKTAMVRLHPSLPDGVHLVLTVHDELVTETPEHLVRETCDAVREAMLGPGIAQLLTVPLTSDVAVCRSWAEAKD